MALRVEEGWRDVPRTGAGECLPRLPPRAGASLLAAHGVDAGALDELELLIEDLRYLRSAPQLSTTDTLRSDALDRSRRLLRRLA